MTNFYNLLGQALIGWIIADFFSGGFHWWEDRVGNTSMPIVGKYVVVPNRRHHVDPLAFTKTSILERNLALWIVLIIIATIWLILLGPSVVWAFAVLGGLVVNEVHVLAHLPTRANKFFQILQQTGIIQSPKHHSVHHRVPNDSRYCILTDWLNPFLDSLKVWEILEKILTFIKLEPNKGTT